MSPHDELAEIHDPAPASPSGNGHAPPPGQNGSLEAQVAASAEFEAPGLEGEASVRARLKGTPGKVIEIVSTIISYINVFHYIAERCNKPK